MRNGALSLARASHDNPGGLPVGRIMSVRRNKTLFWEIQVSAAVDPHRESLVFVLPPVRKSDVTSGPSAAERR